MDTIFTSVARVQHGAPVAEKTLRSHGEREQYIERDLAMYNQVPQVGTTNWSHLQRVAGDCDLEMMSFCSEDATWLAHTQTGGLLQGDGVVPAFFPTP